MSGWAALAGGASGVMSGWDDNREAIKAQAERDFKLQLEQTRMDNVKAASDQQARDMLDPATAQGALAAHNAKTAGQNQQAEWAREDRQSDLDRKNTLATAFAKAGKGGDSGQLKYVQNEIKHYRGIIESGSGDVDGARAELKKLDAMNRELSGVPARKLPSPTMNDIHALAKGDIAESAWRERFGDAKTDDALQRITKEKKEAADAKQADEDAKAKIKKESEGLGDKYPAQGKGMLGGLFDGSSGDSGASYMDKGKAAREKAIESDILGIIDRLKAGGEASKRDLKMLEYAYEKSDVNPVFKTEIEELYRAARGYK